MDIASEKTRARIQAKARRQEFLHSGAASTDRATGSAADRARTASLDLIQHFPIARFRGAVIGGVWPLPGEIDMRPLMQALAQQGHALALPCTPRKGKPLVFRAWEFGQKLRAGPYGTREPKRDAAEVLPDLVLVPLLAFNESGERLGYGGGFYDRTLTHIRSQHEVFACGVAFAAQEAKHIPTGPYDVALDGILTGNYFKAF